MPKVVPLADEIIDLKQLNRQRTQDIKEWIYTSAKHLTRNECIVLSMLMRGYKQADIFKKLNISEAMVSFHACNIKKKLLENHR